MLALYSDRVDQTLNSECEGEGLTFSFNLRLFTSSLCVEPCRDVALSLSFWPALKTQHQHFNLKAFVSFQIQSSGVQKT